MEESAFIIGEIPVDDLRLLEEGYQKGLKALLARRQIKKEDYEGKYIRLLPGKSDVFYVMAVEPPRFIPPAEL